jgi:hypothetical protein
MDRRRTQQSFESVAVAFIACYSRQMSRRRATSTDHRRSGGSYLSPARPNEEGDHETSFLKLGDITEGQVLLSVTSDGPDSLMDERSVQVGDVVEFQVAKKTFYVDIRELRNIAIGTDFGVFEISSSRPTHKNSGESAVEKAEPR